MALHRQLVEHSVERLAVGKVVRWDQPPLPGGGEPQHPAPLLKLTAAGAEPDQHRSAPAEQTASQASRPTTEPDNTSRWLAGAGIIIGALLIALALVTRRRT